MHVCHHELLSVLALAEYYLFLFITRWLVPWDNHTVLCVLGTTERILDRRLRIIARPLAKESGSIFSFTYSVVAEFVTNRCSLTKRSSSDWWRFISVQVWAPSYRSVFLMRDFYHSYWWPSILIGSIGVFRRKSILLLRASLSPLNRATRSHNFIRNEHISGIIDIIRSS